MPASSELQAEERILTRRVKHAPSLDVGGVILGVLILAFAYVHLRFWLHHPGQLNGIGQVALELVQGYLFLIRRRDPAGARPLSIWLAATVGSWGFLAARPAGAGYFDIPGLFGTQAGALWGFDSLWLTVQLVGCAMAIISLSSLGRSFGLLAANRGVRTHGAYQIVRHPAYASYFVVQIGYILENLTVWNLGIFVIVVIAQLTRIHQEEATLAQDAAYRTYMERVPYRLLPGIY